jgi:hypothetical protein
MNFRLELADEFVVADKLNLGHLTHKMAVVVSMGVVVAQHSTVVDSTDAWVDVYKGIPNDLVLQRANSLFQVPPLRLRFSQTIFSRKTTSFYSPVY